MATRALGLIVGFVVALASFQPATPAGTATVAAPAVSNSVSHSNAWSVNDPHLLFLFSQMQMAMGDVNSAVELAARAASLERSKKEATPQPPAIDDDCHFSKAAGGRS